MGAAVLQGLEGGTTGGVQCHNLTIQNDPLRLQPKSRSCNSRVHARQIFIVPGADLDLLPVLDQECAVAIELEFIQPFTAFRQLRDGVGRHGRDE
jgi:hypothetical protein